MAPRRISQLTFALMVGASPMLLQGQSVDEHLAAGREFTTKNPPAALAEFEAVLAVDSTNYEANWGAAQALVDIGKRTPDSVKSRERDSLYARAESLARVAVKADSAGPDGHYMLAAAIGRASLTKSKKERVKPWTPTTTRPTTCSAGGTPRSCGSPG